MPAEPARDLLLIENLQVHFPSRGGRAPTKAVDGISFSIAPGESLGLVGESGSGKSTVGRAILRLIPAAGGRILFEGESVLDAPERRMRRLRQRMQIIFQDPAGSLDPRMRVEDIVSEPLVVHGLARTHAQRRRSAAELLERCGMPVNALDRYPHEFSGGQKQRIGIARALALRPALLVCDEPTSALDVSVQAQIVNLLADLRRDLGLSYLFISHDMAVVHHLCARIVVMRSGRIVEQGPREAILTAPREEYTRALIAAVPIADPRARRPHRASDHAALVSPSIMS